MLLLYALSIFAVFFLGETKKLSLTSISTLQSKPGSQVLYGSQMGGTVLYIKGTGFHQNPSQNEVMIGNYPCIVPEQGIKEQTLLCTTSPILPKQNASNLAIVVVSNKQKVTAKERFSYSPEYTPFLVQVYPPHSYANKKVRFVGTHRISELGNATNSGKVKGLFIGEDICNRNGINQKPINSYLNQSIQCVQAPISVAGKYSVKEQVTYGFTSKSSNLLKTSLYGPKYEYVVLPTVESFFPKNGSIAGEQLTIKGTGFPKSNKDKKNIEVTLDNTECQIVQTSANEIRCNLKKKSANSLKIQNSLNNLEYTYVSGSGFKYSLYEYESSLQSFVTDELNLLSTSKAYESGIKGQLYSVSFDNVTTVEIYEGYFYAPNSGKYAFIAQSNAEFMLYLNPNSGAPSIDKSSHLFIRAQNNTNNTNPYDYLNTEQYKEIDLEAGKYYFMKAYFKRNQAGDSFKVYGQVPNTNMELGWKAPQIQQIKLNFTNQPLIYRLRSLGATSGFINITLLIVNPDTLAVVVNITKILPYDASPEILCAGVLEIQSSFYIFNNDPTCTVTYLDENLDALPSNTPKSSIFGYEWIIQYTKPLIDPLSQSRVILPLDKFQVIYIQAESFNGQAPYFTQQKIQDQGPLINGTFNIISKGSFLNYSSYSVDFPFNVNATTLETSLRRFYNDEKIVVTEVDPEPFWRGQLGKTWTIRYDYSETEFPSLQFITDNLYGGEIGTYPKIYFETVKKYGQKLLYDPVSFQLMKTFSSKPSLIVTVNNIPSICPFSSCQFSYLDETPKVSQLSMTSTNIVINLTAQALKSNSKVQVRINEEIICQSLLFQTNSSIVCNYYKNDDGFSTISAGSYYPSIYLEGVGYLEYEITVPELVIQFSLSNPIPSKGSLLGSYPITLKGKGLPKNSSQLSIKICDIQVQIISNDPSSVTFVAPQIKVQLTQPELNCSIKVLYSNYAPNQVFDGGYFIYEKQLSPPTITSLSKAQSNPTKKGVLQIFGSNFDTNGEMNKLNVNVFLKGLDIDKKYQMRVLQVNNTRIKVGLSGGMTGNYEVQVQIKGKGLAKASTEQSVKFYYANTIQTIAPPLGSYFGGREIQINGNSFSSDIYENQVQIGGQNCAMVQALQNSIKCLSPPKDESNTDQSAEVVVTSRQISKSVCKGTCSFAYMSIQESPMIFSMTQSNTNQVNQEITIEGKNLFNANFETQVIAIHRVSKQKIIFTPLNVNVTHITWKTKAMKAGQYFLFVNVQNVGYSNITLFKVTTVISSVTAALSTQGGIVTIKGFGFPDKLDQQPFEMLMLQSVSRALIQPKIIQLTPQQIKIQILPRKANEKLEIQIIKSFAQKMSYEIQFVDLKTPKAQIISNKQVQWKNTDPIILSITQGGIYVPETVKLTSILQPTEQIQVTWTHNSTHITVQNNLQPGTYKFKIFNSQVGYYQVNDTLTILLPNIVSTFQFVSSSLSVQGGYILVKNTPNSLPQTFGKHSSFLVNGVKTQFKNVNQSYFKISYPSFVRSNKKYAQEIANVSIQPEEKKKLQDFDDHKEQKNEHIDLQDYIKWTDSQNDDLTNSVFDQLTKTTYYSQKSQCQIGIYFGQDNEVEISKIKFYPNKTWQKPGYYLRGGKFQGSSDNITWNDIKTLDTKVERGWNTITFKKDNRVLLRYFRFVHNSNSGCSLGELELKGTKITNKNFSAITNPIVPLTQRSVILSYSDGLTNHEWKDIVFTYSDQQTPVIQSVQPPRGNVKGGEVIELIGTGLGSGTPQVIIDDKVCQIVEFTLTSIKCRTSPRLQTPKRISFEVFVNGKTALIKQDFKYVYRWSDQDTWGVDLPPIEGDLIYIPQNMHLYIDQQTPKLAGIIAQNSTIQISDQLDIEVHTANIILTGATLLAGTALKPYQHKLTFKFYGVEGENQIPFFGNKGIGCSNCKVILHGKEKQSWTRVSSISQNYNQITSTYSQPLNWQNGDEIVVASSSFDYLESQKLTIANIDKTSSLLKLQTKQYFKYDHSSSFEKTKTNDVFVGAQIASLTRNIKLQGDQNSDTSQYGIHLTFIGSQDSGLQVKISNVELKNCGQPKKSRHCINFNRNSDMLKSYIKNSTASQTYGKFITLSSTNFLTVSSNVGYRVKGHNIELKDGTEQNNVIEGNLMISSLPFYRDLQTDVMVASYYISNPNNVIKDNVAAGSYYYGFLYDLKTKSQDGIYAQDSVCTSGYSTGLNKGNVAHSIRKIGVRIKDLITRLNPCQALRNDLLLDPWSVNPSKESLFQNYVIHHNGQLGLMCDSIGHVTFKNFTMAQNNRSHMEFHIMNFTKQNVVVSDSTFVGVVDPVNPPINLNTKALVLPRSGSINFINVLFSKYVQSQTLVQTCSLCNQLQFYTNNGQEYFFEKVQYQNINKATYLQMLGLEREIIYDNDGTFTSGVFDNTARTKATVIKGFQHILSQPGCNLSLNQSLWDGSAVCGSNITIRKVTFMNIIPENSIDFYLPSVSRIPNDVNEPLKQGQLITTLQHTGPTVQIKNSWSAPFVTGSKYQIRTDFEQNHLAIQASRLLKPQDKAIIFKLAYTLTTQLFDVYKMRNLQLGSLINSSKVNNLDLSTCQNGDSYHNNSLRDFQICISGKNSTLYEMIDITAVFCRYECPLPPDPIQPIQPTPTTPDDEPEIVPEPLQPPVPPPIDPNICIRQNFVRKWTNISQWPQNRLPVAGQNVTVHCNWTVELDVDPAPAAHFIIDGHLIVPQNRELVNVTAQSIWVRSGSWKIGSQSDSFDKKMIIQINGNQNDQGFAVDANYAGRKNLLVSGRLQIYGPTNFDESTYLNENAQIGSTLIKVNSANGWNVGDQIVLSTSSQSWNQSQKVKITSINGQQIQISPPLSFFHYGSATPQVDYQNSQLFTSTKVIYVSRNIKIITGPVQSYGFSVFVYGYIDQNQKTHMGSVYMRGVELVNGGQDGSGPAVLGFKNTVSSSKASYVSKCSFVKCQSECVKLENAKNLIFQNNVLYHATRSHIKGIQLRQVRISSNIMIHSRKDTKSSQNVSVCLENRQMINSPYEDNLTIFSNECYGSEDTGFILPYLPCSKNDWEMKNNIAGGCLTGFFMVKLQKQTSKCMLCQHQMAFNCKYGVLGNPQGTTNLTYNKLVLVGNQQGLILRFTTKQKNNTAYLTNSYISPISNKDCTECNIIGGDCSNSVGVRVLSISQTGPGTKFGFNSTQIRSSSPLDAKTFVLNTEFSHFKINYTEIQNLKDCQNNFMFKAHQQAIDLIGSTYLYDSRAVESDKTSLAYFKPFDTKYIGLQGGCGQFNCTSLENYFIQDFSGDVIGSKGSKVLPNNLYFSNKTIGCEYQEIMNGYLCNETEDVSVLELESIARDYNSRIVWPICLISYTNDTINNTLNVQKQWSYRNGYPEGKRKARVSSLIKLNTTYNLTFYNRAPADMIFQIQQKSPTVQDFAWVKLVLQYPDENSIRIKANEKDMNPIILLDNETQAAPSLQVCGSYKYVYSRKYIEFILTTDCRVRMSFVSSVKASIRLDQAVGDFFTNNGTGKFIDKMCVILGITDTSRLKIVGVYTGSTIIDFYIEEQQKTVESNSTLAPSSSQSAVSLQQISQQLDQAVSSGNLQTVLTSAGLGNVLSLTSTVVLVNETGQFQIDQSQQTNPVFDNTNSNDQSSNSTIIIIVCVVSVAVIAVISAAIVYLKFYRKPTVIQNSSVMEEEIKHQVESEIHQEISIEKSSQMQLSYFEQRKKYNLQNVKKNSKIKKTKFSTIQNSSGLNFKNPFDQHYMPQQSHSKVIQDPIEQIDTHKSYKN